MLKKLLAIITLLTTLTVAQDITGSGTVADPYYLYNGADCDSIRYLGLDKVYYLANDVDLSAFADWDPLGNTVTQWTGQFFGQGHSISNLTMDITGSAEHHGFFGFATTDTIVNVKFKNAVITGVGNNSSYSTGVVWGRNLTNTRLDSIYVEDCSIILSASSQVSGVGGIGGAMEAALLSHSYAKRCTLEVGAGGNQQSVGGLIGLMSTGGSMTNSFVMNSLISTNRNAAYAGALTGQAVSVSNCYAMYNTVIDSATTSVGFEQAGAIFGTTATGIQYVYCVGVATYDQLPAANNIFVGYASNNVTACYADSTYPTPDESTLQVATSVTGITAQNTTEMQTQGTYSGWDFTTVWAIDPSINDGYPYLADNEPNEPITVTYPNGGEILAYDTTVTVTWTNPSDPTVDVKYSTNNGVDWIVIQSGVTGSSCSWSVPNLYTEQALVKVFSTSTPTTDVSNDNFVILPTSLINILSPIDSTIVQTNVNATVNIIFESVLVNEVALWWGPDTLNLTFIDSVAVDTVNNAFADTSVYAWTLPWTVSYDSIYIQIVEGPDTTLYGFTVPYQEIGSRLGSTVYCTYDSGGTVLQSFWVTDPSCGWVSTITWTYITKTMAADLSGYYTVSNACPYDTGTGHSGSSCIWPYNVGPYYDNGVDTTLLTLNEFYTLYGYVGTGGVTYNGRYYYSSGGKMMMNDLVNGITGIELFTLPTAGGSDWDDFMIYHVRWDSLQDKIMTDPTDVSALVADDFIPAVMVTQSDYPYQTIIFDVLPYPADATPAEDTALAFTSMTYTRNYFRGIHPKAEKRN